MLQQITHAARLGQPITVEVRGQYQFSKREEEVLFQQEFTSESAPTHILEPLQVGFKSIEIPCACYHGTGLPRSCIWASAGVPREEIEITVSKIGIGIHVTHGYREAKGLSIKIFPSRFRASLIDKWAIIFGTSETPSDKELMQRLAFITAPWNEAIDSYGTS
jgi:hypothetical protein